MAKKPIRIHTGKYRFTPIFIKNNIHGIRPTPSKVREILFNWLKYFWNEKFSDKKVLDLFTGSGSVGFEAASRGFGHIDMVEKDRKTVIALLQLKNKLKAENITIQFSDALKVLKNFRSSQFDLIVLDPPFGKNLIEKILEKISILLRKEGFIFAETNIELKAPENLEIIRNGKVGKVYFYLLRKKRTSNQSG